MSKMPIFLRGQLLSFAYSIYIGSGKTLNAGESCIIVSNDKTHFFRYETVDVLTRFGMIQLNLVNAQEVT